ncbi:MAG: ATP-binding protein [Acidobacteriota bacterium]
MMRKEIQRQIKWLMVFRVVVITTLLISSFIIELLYSPSRALEPLYFLSAFTYFLVIAYGFLYPSLKEKESFVYIQGIGDTLVITGFVYITGGLDSPMSFLYILPIITASIMLYRKGAFIVATACFFFYLLLIGFLIYDIVPFYSTSYVQVMEVTKQKLYYALSVNFIGLFVVAYLSSYLSERLRITGKELEEKQDDLDELKAIHEKILESIGTGLITTDLMGKIIFMNRGGAEITGIDPLKSIGRSVKDLFDLNESFLWKIRSILEEEKRFRFERSFRRAQGGERYLGFAVSRLRNGGGRSLGLVFIFQDLTEIIAMEKEMRLKERMAALGEMAAGMAHELRNPLASISGSVQILKNELDLNGENLDLMDIILMESERLEKTIRDFLMFAKPGKFSPERADVVLIIEESVRLLKNSKEFGRKHSVVTEFSSPEIISYIDVNRMKQVFWNLATNSLKAMPNGGTLTIKVDGSHRNALTIVFSDSGIGMDKREAESYFQPFEGTFKEGTGLGAAIVYKIIQEHGGRIDVKSRIGEGTTVKIVIPRKSDELNQITEFLKAQTGRTR